MRTFNLSPSAINLYRDSPILFYFSQIEKRPVDSLSVKVYGDAGNCVHKAIEAYNNKTDHAEKVFDDLWKQYGLHEKPGFNGKVLSYQNYKEALDYGIQVICQQYTVQKTEEQIVLPFIENDEWKIQIKGIIDCQAILKNGQCVVVDWKTSSDIKEDDDAFHLQGKHYCYLIWKKYGYIPSSVCFEYLRLKKKKEYAFTEIELRQYENYLQKLVWEIMKKDDDISQYDFGNCFDSPFNDYKKSCLDEQKRRESSIKIQVVLRGRHMILSSNIPSILLKVINQKFSYLTPGHQFNPLFRAKRWDGKKYFLKQGKLPIAFLDKTLDLVKDYNKYFKTNYVVDVRDEREFLPEKGIEFGRSDKELRYYQEEAVQIAMEKKIGILYLSTGAGKTLVSAELIRRVNKKTLFLINRIELVDQTQKEYEKFLKVPIGKMSEGVMDIDKHVTVASIQTIDAILKRRNADSKLLQQYLSTVSILIYDEAHGAQKIGMYGVVDVFTPNKEYCIGLTGTAFRNDGTTLEMNALVGFPIYVKTALELEKEGYLCPTKAYFIKNKMVVQPGKEYADLYRSLICENKERNKLCEDIVNQYRATKKILILTKLVDHASMLGNQIFDSYVITGSTDTEKRKETFENFKKQSGKVLIGSLKIFGTGIDIPDLDIIINMTSHKSSVDSIQVIGRLKRKSPGKQFGYFIDFDDDGSFFRDSARERKKILKMFGNEVIEVKDKESIHI